MSKILLTIIVCFSITSQEIKLEGSWKHVDEDVRIEFDNGIMRTNFKGVLADTTITYEKIMFHDKKTLIIKNAIFDKIDTVFYRISNDTLYTKTHSTKQEENNFIRTHVLPQ